MKKHTSPIGALLIILFLCSYLNGCANRQIQVDPGPDPVMMTIKNELSASLERISQLEGRLNQLEIKVASGEKMAVRIKPESKPAKVTAKTTQAGTPKVKTPPVPAESIYNNARAEYKRKEYSLALTGFETLLKTYPHDDLADNAIYWMGECYYSRKEYRKAIDNFKIILSEYPEGGKVPDTLLKIAYSYKQLNDIPSTRLFLKKVIKAYPFNPSGIKAEAMLKTLE